MSLSSSHLPKYTQYIFLVEVETPLFDTIDSKEWQNLQCLVGQATHMVWVTTGGLLSGREPLFAMIGGIVRGLKTEKSSLRVSTLDLDLDTGGSILGNCDTMFTILDRLSQDNAEGYTLEYRQKDLIIYRGSLQPDDELNAHWQDRARESNTTHILPLDQLRHIPLQLSIREGRGYEDKSFELDPDFDRGLLDEWVEIELGAIGINGKVSLFGSPSTVPH